MESIGRPDIGGPFTLVDEDGVPVTNMDYIGKFTMIYFGFTFCPDICPNELVKIGNVLDKLGMCFWIENRTSFKKKTPTLSLSHTHRQEGGWRSNPTSLY